MVHPIKSSCRLSKEFNKELDELIEYANKFEQQQNDMNEEMKRLQNEFADRERMYLDQKQKCINECRSIETEAMVLMEELKSVYEEKIDSIKKHYEKQFMLMVQKHKSEIQTWRIKYESIEKTIKSSSSKETVKNEKIDQQQEQKFKAEIKRLEERNDELERENKHLKTRVETSENRIEQNEAQRKTIENDLRKSKHECNDRNEEIRKQKLKITELEKAIDKQKRQSDEKESKISELRKKNEKLEKEVAEMATPIKSTPSTTSTAEIILPHGKMMDENFTSGYGGLYSSSDNDNDDVQTLKSKLIISERDMRAVNRKLENKTEICNILRTELSEIKQKLTDYEKSLVDEKKRSNGYSEMVSTYRSELDQNKQEIERKDTEIVNLKCLVDENNNNFILKLKVNANANNFFDDQQNSNSAITATTSGSSNQPSNMVGYFQLSIVGNLSISSSNNFHHHFIATSDNLSGKAD